jgi:hypothetical protein
VEGAANQIVHHSFACLFPLGETLTEAGLDFIEIAVLRGGELRSDERAALSMILDRVDESGAGSRVRARAQSLRVRYAIAP